MIDSLYKEDSDSTLLRRTAKEMNVAFYEEYLPFTNFETLLTLLEKEGNLDSQKEIVEAYRLDESCEEFVRFMASYY